LAEIPTIVLHIPWFPLILI